MSFTEEELHEIFPDDRLLDVAERDDGCEDLADAEVLGHVGEFVRWVGHFGRELARDLGGEEVPLEIENGTG